MSANFIEIQSQEQLDGLFKSSYERPVAILKHSNTCGISAHIYETVAEVDATVNVVVVQNHRDISDHIAELTGHRHQSPQAFVIKNGKAVYHATHYGIEPDKIKEALNK
jgi:bacillithiol system protein YtxJ